MATTRATRQHPGSMSRHHHATPSVALVAGGATTIRTSDLLGALSRALDLTEGLLPGHAARTCWIAMRMAERSGMPAQDR